MVSEFIVDDLLSGEIHHYTYKYIPQCSYFLAFSILKVIEDEN